MPDLTAEGIRFHYVSAPASPRNPAIVFLHGAGANHTIWLGQMKALRDSAWVVVPDLPGHGRSSAIPGLTIDEHARALVPFLNMLRSTLPPAKESGLILAGHSMGGAVALAVALTRPDLLAGLVLIGAGAKLGVAREIIEGLKTSPSETQALVARWSFADSTSPDLVLRTMKDLVGTPASRTLADFEACNAFDVRSRVGDIAVPTLLLCGREDRLTPPKYSEFLHSRIQGSKLHLIDKAGHAVMIEAAAQVSTAIAEFAGSIIRA